MSSNTNKRLYKRIIRPLIMLNIDLFDHVKISNLDLNNVNL